jgi:hypothetical protein
MFYLVWRSLIFRYQMFLFFQGEKYFVIDIKIWHLNVLFRNVAVSLRNIIISNNIMLVLQFHFGCWFGFDAFPQNIVDDVSCKQYDKYTFSILYKKPSNNLLFCTFKLKISSGNVMRQPSVQVATSVIYLGWFRNRVVILRKWQPVLLLTCSIKISTWYSWTESTCALMSWRVPNRPSVCTHRRTCLYM